MGVPRSALASDISHAALGHSPASPVSNHVDEMKGKYAANADAVYGVKDVKLIGEMSWAELHFPWQPQITLKRC